MKEDANQSVENDQQATLALGGAASEVTVTRSLSAQLLLLTIAFVTLAEILIYVPSVARDRLVFLDERIVAADLVILALEIAPNKNVSDALALELLEMAGVRAIVLRGPLTRRLVVADRTPEILAETFDLRDVSDFQGIRDAFSALVRQQNRVIRVIGQSSQNPDSLLEVVIDEAPMRAQMIVFSERLLSFSVVILLVAAGLVFITLDHRMVRPMRRLTRSMVKFRRRPEDPKLVIVPSKRRDEIGVAERELCQMQASLSAALRQKERLAKLGLVVMMINHDLRNILATATLISDRIASIGDPEVQKITPTLIQSIDRAVALCNNTLRFSGMDEATPQLNKFNLQTLVEDVGTAAGVARDGAIRWNNEVPERFMMVGDRDQIFRALLNLARNSVQAIDGMGNGVNGSVGEVTTRAARGVEKVEIEIADTGPGMPTWAIESVFQPFSGAAKAEGSGLGLAIVRDLVRAHGGDVALVGSGEGGTKFRMEFPGA
jgi:signal transduction histidine kinase